VTESLWVISPGGYRVATDEVLALMDWLERQNRAVGVIADDTREARAHCPIPSINRATNATDDLLEWLGWMSRALDTYCQQVAENERRRVAIVEKPRDEALGALSRYGAGHFIAHVAGVPGAAAVALGAYSAQASVTVAGRRSGVPIAMTMAERVARIPETENPIRIDTYSMPDGTRHVEVFIAGTAEFDRNPSESSFDMSSNLALVAGVTSASMVATQKAMASAGITPADRVLFVGHSQGGTVAARLAESGRYTTVGLLTVGAPTGSAPVKGSYPALIIEHRDDVVPGLAGAREPTNAYVVSTRSDALPGDVIGAHRRESYQLTAERVNQSPAQELQQLATSLPRGVRGESVVFREREG